eukprot:gnl/TRDRNA2_/TRDRNA2_43483_c0_seq2.p1 gnl/TRDRNA2_/TRDRNA2_43483_c0~~gnl/TRDRNA2_/TRDRNA2_43483_c0_seq2.p1  ORF type:complete len:449 (-),score=111.59 gnl/TRDRNA2_/TRDRNA2_43483_c0_seq2:34-1311(-)
MVKKQEIEELEAKQARLESSTGALKSQVSERHRVLEKSKLKKESTRSELNTALAESARQTTEATQSEDALEQVRREVVACQSALSSLNAAIEYDTKMQEFGVKMRTSLYNSLQELHKNRDTIRAFTSEDGEQMALDSPPVSPTRAGEAHSSAAAGTGDLWARDDEKIPQEFRMASQGTAICAALAQSMSIRAAELREGMLQVRFSRDAVARTKEVIALLEKRGPESETTTAEMKKEAQELVVDCGNLRAELEKLQSEHRMWQSRHFELTQTLCTAQETTAKMEDEAEKCRLQMQSDQAEYRSVELEHHQDENRLEAHKQVTASFMVESERRRNAANALLEELNKQAQASSVALERTRQEHQSFLTANEALNEAHQILLKEIAAKTAAYEQLSDEHATMNYDLNALARHYMDLLVAPHMQGALKLR